MTSTTSEVIAAAVGFDPTDQKFVVVNGDKIDATSAEGDALNIDGRSLTILQICDSVDGARQAAEEKANEMLNLNGMGIASITYDDEPQSSSSGTDNKEEDDDEDREAGLAEGTTAATANIQENGEILVDQQLPYDMLDFEASNSMQLQMDHLRGSVRQMVAMTMADLKTDMERLQQRYDGLARFFQTIFATEADGRIATTFADTNGTRKPFSFGSLGESSSNQRKNREEEEDIGTYFDRVDRQYQQEMNRAEQLLRSNSEKVMTSSTSNGNNNVASTSSKTWKTGGNGGGGSRTKELSEQQTTGEMDYSFGTSGTQGKRIVNGIVKTVNQLTYPFLTQEEEESCLDQCQGVAPIYAQLLAKMLFADTIELYFKDQDTAKRNWLHDAVDYRFPTLDKPTHVSKWKNCSYFINKNMREAVQQSGNPMPRAPCGPRGPIGPKDKFRKEAPSVDTEDDNNSMIDNILKEVQPKYRHGHHENHRKSSSHGGHYLISKQPAHYKYLSMSYEKECFDECRGDQYKYAELMALRLFSESLPLKFKEQDAAKKEWLRHCVESRFPMEEGQKNDQRWKICGQTCNRNRTKIVGADGREEKYPYFSVEIEEECFRKSGGLASVYAELMNARLFPDTQHLFFKDQDIGRRNWLHSILDKRFPTDDRMSHVSKWKTCTNAINKKLFDGTVTPITKEDVLAASMILKTLKQEEPEIEDEEMEEEEQEEEQEEEEEEEQEQPKVLPKFERKIPEMISAGGGGGLKRKLEEENNSMAAPSPAKRESIRNKIKKEKEYSELYSAYPYITEEEEVEIFEASNGNPHVYGRELGRVLFKDTLKLYFKDQDVEKRQWIKEILEFRFPSKNVMDQKQKWKNVMAAINKNMTGSAAPSRRSVSKS